MQGIIQNNTKFIPTALQIVYADAYIEHRSNISKACDEVEGVSRNTYYQNWIKQEGFELWLQAYAKTEVLKRRGKWYLILEKYAEGGSFQHLNLLMQIANEFKSGEAVINNWIVQWKEKADKPSKTDNRLRTP